MAFAKKNADFRHTSNHSLILDRNCVFASWALLYWTTESKWCPDKILTLLRKIELTVPNRTWLGRRAIKLWHIQPWQWPKNQKNIQKWLLSWMVLWSQIWIFWSAIWKYASKQDADFRFMLKRIRLNPFSSISRLWQRNKVIEKIQTSLWCDLV
jgi:hypothetical protein